MIDLCFIYPLPGCVKILLLVIPCSDVRSSVAWWRPVAVVSRSTTPMPRSVRGDEGAEGIDGARSWRIWDILQWGLLNDTKCQVWEFFNITRKKKTSVRDDNCTVDYYIYIYISTFKFQLRNGEDLGYSTDGQPGFFCTNRRGCAPLFVFGIIL